MSLITAPRCVVVDASVAVDLISGDASWMDRWAAWQESDTQLLAPPTFRHEVANALLRGQRQSAAVTTLELELLFATGIEIADRRLAGLVESVALADGHSLSVYDAAYLQLALDTEADLATLDRALAAAARAAGLVVHDGATAGSGDEP